MFDESQMQALDRLALAKVEKLDDTLRVATHGHDGNREPPGFIRLRTPQERTVWTDYLKRQALAEQGGQAPGDTAATMLSHPVMQPQPVVQP